MLPSSSLLTVENLRANYGAARILHGVSFTLAAGEVLVLLGRNGAGKSTTLKTLIGLLPPAAGRIRLDRADIAGWEPHRSARLGLAADALLEVEEEAAHVAGADGAPTGVRLRRRKQPGGRPHSAGNGRCRAR